MSGGRADDGSALQFTDSRGHFIQRVSGKSVRKVVDDGGSK